MCAIGMSSEFAKSGPSGITIMKSRMLTNCTAATSSTIVRSLRKEDAAEIGAADETGSVFACGETEAGLSRVISTRKGNRWFHDLLTRSLERVLQTDSNGYPSRAP